MAESAPSRPPLALVANGHEWSIRSLESILAPAGYATIRAYNGEQTIRLAGEANPDLIVIDASFPDMLGLEVCRKLQNDPRVSRVAPILMTTASRRTRQDRLEALEAGAWDFIVLPLDAEEFLLRVSAYMKLKLEADRTREESLVDEATSLYNLRGLMRRTREVGSDALRHGRALACVAFAPHPSGDERNQGENEENGALSPAVLQMARVFKSAGRISDAIGRVRHGEFAVVAPGTDATGALKLAKRIIAACERSENDVKASLRTRTILAGYDAVSNLREAGIQPAALLAGATTALRLSLSEEGGPAIRRYEGHKKPGQAKV